jgi:hypothetical protein
MACLVALAVLAGLSTGSVGVSNRLGGWDAVQQAGEHGLNGRVSHNERDTHTQLRMHRERNADDGTQQASQPTTVMRVLIDNSGARYHGETVLSVMRLVQCLYPGRAHHFFVDEALGVYVDPAFQATGLAPLWEVCLSICSHAPLWELGLSICPHAPLWEVCLSICSHAPLWELGMSICPHAPLWEVCLSICCVCIFAFTTHPVQPCLREATGQAPLGGVCVCVCVCACNHRPLLQFQLWLCTLLRLHSLSLLPTSIHNRDECGSLT